MFSQYRLATTYISNKPELRFSNPVYGQTHASYQTQLEASYDAIVLPSNAKKNEQTYDILNRKGEHKLLLKLHMAVKKCVQIV